MKDILLKEFEKIFDVDLNCNNFTVKWVLLSVFTSKE